jgi:hypothetical protein
MKIILWILFIVSSIAVLLAIASIIYGSQPCSGDGCIIHLFQIIGLLLLIVFGPTCWFVGKKLKIWKKERR